MRQYASTHLDPGETPEVYMVRDGTACVATGGPAWLFARPEVLRSFCASIIAQIDALEGGEAA